MSRAQDNLCIRVKSAGEGFRDLLHLSDGHVFASLKLEQTTCCATDLE